MTLAWQPYADGTSGHSGSSSLVSEPIRRRFLDIALEGVARSGHHGITWYELSVATGKRQGTCGSSLSNLHRNGIIARLEETRAGAGIYVLPDNIRDRQTVPFNERGLKVRCPACDFIVHIDVHWMDDWDVNGDPVRIASATLYPAEHECVVEEQW